MHLLDKKSQMILEIYVVQVLQPLTVLFYKECLGEIGEIIYMNDSAAYHTSKLTKKFCAEVGVLSIICPAQSPDLNPIENL